MVQNNEGVAFMPRMCVRPELEQGTLCSVKVDELSVERKIRLVYPARRALSHAARAFLDVISQPVSGGRSPAAAYRE
jgi:DNA-binding transcriptional LysR family regulator